ncbi:MAG: efflux transporter outer membrane subunit [Rhodocyclaceae bacterium]
MRFKFQLAWIALALSVSGCSTIWPEYEKPAFDLPAASAKPVAIDRQWWRAFNDPLLNALVDEALANNWDMAKAAANVAEARAAVDAARSQLLPRVDGLAKAGSTKRQLTLGSQDIDKTTSTGSIGAALNWEIDLWDRIGQMNDAALARFAASEHARNATNLSISGLVTDTWFQLRGLDAKLAITRDAVASLKYATNLEYRRWKAEAGTELAYTQSLAEYSSTMARLPDLEGAIAQTELALKLLVGRSPRGMNDAVPRGERVLLPDTPREVDSVVLLRRPDVASAELLLVAAHADVNSARAEFYPRLTLSLLAGFVTSTSKAISGMPLFWDASAGLTGPIFDGGLVQSKVDSAEARRQKALAHYQYTVSAAFRDTYQSLVLMDTSDREVKSREDEVATRRRAMVLAEKSYDAGRTSKFEVLTETIRVLNSQLFLVDAMFGQFTARSRYYKALGGGF